MNRNLVDNVRLDLVIGTVHRARDLITTIRSSSIFYFLLAVFPVVRYLFGLHESLHSTCTIHTYVLAFVVRTIEVSTVHICILDVRTIYTLLCIMYKCVPTVRVNKHVL